MLTVIGKDKDGSPVITETLNIAANLGDAVLSALETEDVSYVEVRESAETASRLYYCKACGHYQRGSDCDLMKCRECGECDWSPRT